MRQASGTYHGVSHNWYASFCQSIMQLVEQSWW